jgi:hypothetical protein
MDMDDRAEGRDAARSATVGRVGATETARFFFLLTGSPFVLVVLVVPVVRIVEADMTVLDLERDDLLNVAGEEGDGEAIPLEDSTIVV